MAMLLSNNITKSRLRFLPETRRLGQPRILGLQPLIVQLLQVLGRDRSQRAFDDAGQLRPVPARGHAQQLRETDIAHHRQPGEFRLDRQTPELRFIDHGVTSLLTQQQLQRLALQRHALQVQMGIIAAQIIGGDAGHAHRDAGLAVEFFSSSTAPVLFWALTTSCGTRM